MLLKPKMLPLIYFRKKIASITYINIYNHEGFIESKYIPIPYLHHYFQHISVMGI